MRHKIRVEEDNAILIESIHRASIEPERFGVSRINDHTWLAPFLCLAEVWGAIHNVERLAALQLATEE